MASARRSSGAALIVLGAVPLMLSVFVSGPYLWGRSVEGRVVELQRGSKGGCSPVVSYEVDGQSLRLDSDVRVSPCGWTVGDRVDVHFVEGAPADGYLLTFSTTMPIWVLGLLGLGLAGVGALRLRPPAAPASIVGPPVVRLEGAPLGRRVAVRGRVAARTPLRAPLTDRPCVAWQVVVRRPLLGEEGDVVCRASRGNGFDLTDGDTVLAIPPRATLRLRLEPSARGECRRQEDAALAALLRERGVDRIDADPRQNDYDWTEAAVRDGDEVVVEAHLELAEPGEAAAYRGGSRRLRATSAPGDAILVRSLPVEVVGPAEA